MNNILENPTFVAHRGQLYDGERQSIYGEGGFAFGQGEYFSTGFGDASCYAKADPLFNRDLSGNISRIAELHGETYLETKEDILKQGDGMVLTAVLQPKRTIVYGGDKFTDISDIDSFRRKFEFALRMCDAPYDLCERITTFVIKKNNEPQLVMSRLAQEKLTPALREYAINNNCDSFKLDSNLTPADWVNRYEKPTHITMLDKDKIQFICSNKPITPDPLVHGLSTDTNERTRFINEFSKEVSNKESDIMNKHGIFIAAMKEKANEEPDSEVQNIEQTRPEPKKASKLKL